MKAADIRARLAEVQASKEAAAEAEAEAEATPAAVEGNTFGLTQVGVTGGGRAKYEAQEGDLTILVYLPEGITAEAVTLS